MTSLLRRSFFRFLLTVALCAATSLAMYSQSTTDGAIGGSVTDQHKGLVPNAKVTVRNTETNMEGNAVTDEAGGFRIVQLRSEERRVGKECRDRGTTVQWRD